MSYQEFVQRVRRYRPSDLIPVLAQFSAERFEQAEIPEPLVDFPWAISAIARDAVLYGNEQRDAHVDRTILKDLVSAFNITDGGRRRDGVARMLTSVAYEQFPYQESDFEELARIYALFEDPALGPTSDWTKIFGMSLAEAVRAAFVLRVWVARMGGRFDPTLGDLPSMQDVFKNVAPREQVETVAALLTTTIDEAKRASEIVPALPRHLKRYAFNPLVARPLVDLGEKGIWAPQAMFVDRALHPINLYYRAWDAWDKKFADDLGPRVEAYVGRQLRLIADEADLHSEIDYKDVADGNMKKSIDWFWVTDKAVILIECKSARLPLHARAGDASLSDLASRTLVKARDQLDTSARFIRDRTAPFDQFPADRPIIGLAVTCEPFYLANSTFDEYGANSSIPSLVISLRELEHWVCLPASDAVGKLLDVLADPERRTWLFSAALGEMIGATRNSILDEAWTHYDFIDKQFVDSFTRTSLNEET